MECFYIKHFGRADIGLGNLVNMTDGGEGNHNRKHSQETKDKISKNSAKIWLGKKLSLETRAKLSESHIGIQSGESHPLFGKHHSQETKDKIGASNRGNKHSKKTLKKMSEAKVGKIKSKEHRMNLSKSLIGKPKSDEHKRNISKSKKGKSLTKKHKKNISESLIGKKCSTKTADIISEKAKNRSINKGKKTSKYKGITWVEDRKKWKASVFIEGKTRFVGYFIEEELAFKKYNEFIKTFNYM